MTRSERGSAWVGALIGALGMAVVWGWFTPSEEKVIKRAWNNGALLETIDAQSTGDLVMMKRLVLFELECRTDRDEIEALLKAATPQVVPWCRNTALPGGQSGPPRE